MAYVQVPVRSLAFPYQLPLLLLQLIILSTLIIQLFYLFSQDSHSLFYPPLPWTISSNSTSLTKGLH